jgi:pilus assembly protein CpaB
MPSLVLALGMALAAALAAYHGIKGQEASILKQWKTTLVVVADRDIAEGTVLSMEMLSQKPVPEQFVTSSVVRPRSVEAILNQRVVVPLQRGDPLLWTQLETTRTQQRLSATIEKRLRAVAIDAARSASVGGWVRPNDHVDVIGTFKDPQTNEDVAVTLLQNLIVLATGKITGTTNVNLLPESQRDYQSVSLLVGPEEAEILTLAAQQGQLTLSLRNEDDSDTLRDRGRTTLRTLLSGERSRQLQESRQRSSIRIMRGARAVETQPFGLRGETP